jgi:hypothetical protein
MSLSEFIESQRYCTPFGILPLLIELAKKMELLQLEFFINMEYYILLATSGLSLVSYTLGLDLIMVVDNF